MIRSSLLAISALGTVAAAFFWPIQGFLRVQYYYEWFQTNSNMVRIVEEARNRSDKNVCPKRHLAERYDEYPLVVRDTSIRVEFDDNCRTMTLTAHGPNRRDDDGNDDDVVMHVDMTTYEFAWPAFPRNSALSVLCRAPMWAVIPALAAYPLIVLLFGSASGRRALHRTVAGVLATVALASCILQAVSLWTSIRWETEHWSNVVSCGPSYTRTKPQTAIAIARGSLWIDYSGPSGIRCGCVPPIHNQAAWLSGDSGWFQEAFGYWFGWESLRSGCSHPHFVRLVARFWPLFVISAPYPLWILLLRPMRQRRRRERNACSRCTYNLKGNLSGICPECGTPITEQNPSPAETES